MAERPRRARGRASGPKHTGRSRQTPGAHAARRRAGKGVPVSASVPEEEAPSGAGMRLNRYIARSGLCSRREADEWIVAGRVHVNGETVTELGTRVAEGDRVVVNGRRISPRRAVYFLVNKPSDTITTTADERGRRTVLDLFADSGVDRSALFPVGRLDRETTGVLLVTSDGELAHRLMHPSYEIEKLYRVVTEADVDPEQLERLRLGVELDDGPAAADHVDYIALPDRRQIGVSLHEGRNRQVRRMFEALGHRVISLDRIRYAGLTTRGVRRGSWRRLTDREVSRLYKLVKLKSNT